MPRDNHPPIKITEATSSGLRKTLIEALDDMRNKRISPHEAASIARLSQAIINSVRLEIEYFTRVAAANPASPAKEIRPLALVTGQPDD